MDLPKPRRFREPRILRYYKSDYRYRNPYYLNSITAPNQIDVNLGTVASFNEYNQHVNQHKKMMAPTARMDLSFEPDQEPAKLENVLFPFWLFIVTPICPLLRWRTRSESSDSLCRNWTREACSWPLRQARRGPNSTLRGPNRSSPGEQFAQYLIHSTLVRWRCFHRFGDFVPRIVPRPILGVADHPTRVI